jgi:hypothetical protein
MWLLSFSFLDSNRTADYLLGNTADMLWYLYFWDYVLVVLMAMMVVLFVTSAYAVLQLL